MHFRGKKEIERMQSMYENNKGIHDKMDLLTFAQTYYDGLLAKYKEARAFWEPDHLAKYFKSVEACKPKEPKKKVVVIKKKPKEGAAALSANS